MQYRINKMFYSYNSPSKLIHCTIRSHLIIILQQRRRFLHGVGERVLLLHGDAHGVAKACTDQVFNLLCLCGRKETRATLLGQVA